MDDVDKEYLDAAHEEALRKGVHAMTNEQSLGEMLYAHRYKQRPAIESRPICFLENEPVEASTAASTAASTTAPAAFAAFLVVASILASIEASIFASVDASIIAIIAIIVTITEATHIRSTFHSFMPKDIGYYSICGCNRWCSVWLMLARSGDHRAACKRLRRGKTNDTCTA